MVANEEPLETKPFKTEENEDIVEERLYVIPLKQAWIAPIKKRTPRAIRVLKGFIKKHMKIESFIISKEVNEFIWNKGIEGAPRKIRVRVVRNKEGDITVYLAEGS
ncbi:MAG: 60S ribosomal protein L31 [Candidatus Bathyarchaeota archaeon]|nr:MAG: 60S ribosomal protein L31 [Candidatus Bathyarchaeota archaeon]